MTYTRAIGIGCDFIIKRIVRGLALSRIHPTPAEPHPSPVPAPSPASFETPRPERCPSAP